MTIFALSASAITQIGDSRAELVARYPGARVLESTDVRGKVSLLLQNGDTAVLAILQDGKCINENHLGVARGDADKLLKAQPFAWTLRGDRGGIAVWEARVEKYTALHLPKFEINLGSPRTLEEKAFASALETFLAKPALMIIPNAMTERR